MIKVFSIIVLCTLLCMIVVGVKFRSDYKYFDTLGGWLKYHSVPAVWNDARLRCHLEGGVLASPLKEDLGLLMIALMKEDEAPAIYTGIHATYSQGDYASIEGVPLKEIPKLKGKHQIDNKNNMESCLVMFNYGTLADMRCSDVFPYICYKKYDPLMAAPTECGTVDKEYSYSEVTGHCYKFHSYAQPWDRAYMACAAEGGYLAIINSENEAQVLRELFGKYPANAIIGRLKDGAHVGFKADRENNFWITIHGQTLKDAGYANWDGPQPDNYTGNQHCGNIFRNGRLDDNDCETNSPFICEKHPESLQD